MRQEEAVAVARLFWHEAQLFFSLCSHVLWLCCAGCVLVVWVWSLVEAVAEWQSGIVAEWQAFAEASLSRGGTYPVTQNTKHTKATQFANKGGHWH